MMIVYRILGFIVNFFCAMLAFQLLIGIGTFISNPAFYFPLFIIISVVLYAWFSYKFYNKVLIKKEPITKKTKDWLQVNAIVTFIFSILMIIQASYLMYHPEPYIDMLKKLATDVPIEYANSVLKVMLFFAIVILAHVIWTYYLLRKNKEFIVNK